MNDLFDNGKRPDNGLPTGGSDGAKQPIDASIIKPTPELPATGEPYRNPKVQRSRQADPIGLIGLPDTRAELDAKLLELCNRLAAAAGQMVSAHRLVDEMHLSDDRTLRLLLAYGHVQHRIRSLVGIEGVGYCWGDLSPGAYERAAAVAQRKGLCSMYLASLYSRKPPAVQIAQMALGFNDGRNDELDAWLAGENITPSGLIEAIISTFAGTAEGRMALAEVGARHADLLMPETLHKELLNMLDEMRARLVELTRKAG